MQEQHFLSIAGELKAQLAAAVEHKKTFEPWDRDDALSALRVIHQAVEGLMDEWSESGTFTYQHKATSLIEALIDQLNDLENGMVGEILKPAPGLGGARYAIEDEKLRRFAIEAAEIIRRAKGITLTEANRIVANDIAKQGVKIRKKTPTPDSLQRYRNYKRKAKKPK